MKTCVIVIFLKTMPGFFMLLPSHCALHVKGSGGLSTCGIYEWKQGSNLRRSMQLKCPFAAHTNQQDPSAFIEFTLNI